MHALLAARVLYGNPASEVLDVIRRTLEFLNEDGRFGRYMDALREAGWDLEIAALETTSGRRISTTSE